jgi:hypothetical protein
MQDFFFGKTIILKAMLLEFVNILLKSTHLQFIPHYMKHIATGNNAKLGVESLHHLDINIIDSVKYYGVNIFQYYMLFYHFEAKLQNILENTPF